MEEIQTCIDNHAGFAVIRNYAPARIERELLARVLELIGPGSASERMQSADLFDPCLPNGRSVVGGESMEHQNQPLAQEPAA